MVCSDEQLCRARFTACRPCQRLDREPLPISFCLKASFDDGVWRQGIGPATASGVLAAFDASLPFMDDDVMAACLEGPKVYTLKRYMQLVPVLQDKAKALGEHPGGWGSLQQWEPLPCCISFC